MYLSPKSTDMLRKCLFLGIAIFVLGIILYGLGTPMVTRAISHNINQAITILTASDWQNMNLPKPELTPEVGKDCTVFYAADDKVALGGNNEDGRNPNTMMWVLPPEKEKYGRIYFGYDNYYPQGGMNDQGLFFDATATAPYESSQPNRPMYQGVLLERVMEKCATVEEALDYFRKYRFYNVNLEGVMVLIGDKTGDSAVIEGNVILRKTGLYQVLTNFRQSLYESEAIPCPRFRTAVDILGKADSLSIDLFKQVLIKTTMGITLYSNVYDLKQGIIYLYNNHNFNKVIEIHLEEELKKGKQSYDLPSLFMETERAQRLREEAEAVEKNLAAQATAGRDPKVYSDYVGTYKSEGMTIRLSLDGDRLFMERDELPKLEMFPQSETTFVHPSLNGNLQTVFIRDEQGQVTRLIFRGFGMEFELKKDKATSYPYWWVWLISAILIMLLALAGWYGWRKRHHTLKQIHVR